MENHVGDSVEKIDGDNDRKGVVAKVMDTGAADGNSIGGSSIVVATPDDGTTLDGADGI